MGYIVKRNGSYRVRYRDPAGKMRSKPRSTAKNVNALVSGGGKYPKSAFL